MFKTSYPQIDPLIVELKESARSALGDKLKGLYIFGSIVGGGFNMETSDIDLLAVVESVVTKEELAKLKKMHEGFASAHPEWCDRIEVAYVSIEALKNFKTVTSQIARTSPGEPLRYRDMDIQWLMDWYMVQDQGLTVFGPPPQTYIPHITSREFIDSLKKDFPSWADAAKNAKHVGYQSYIILSVCRNLYAIKFGHQVSKVEGGHWAIKEYPAWKELIEQALKWHGSPDKSDSHATQAKTKQFVDFALAELQAPGA